MNAPDRLRLARETRARIKAEQIALTHVFVCKNDQHGPITIYARDCEAWCPCGRMRKEGRTG